MRPEDNEIIDDIPVLPEPTNPTEPKSVTVVRKMGKIGEYILFALFLALLVFGVVTYANRDLDMSPVKEANKNFKTLQNDIDSIKLIQKFLIEKSFEQDARAIELQANIEQFGYKIDVANNKLTKLQKSYNEKIGTIDKYTRTQLDSFFADYYNKHRNQ